MKGIEWRRVATGHYRSVCGRCEIERDQFNRWQLGVDGWWRGNYGILGDAKKMASEAKDFHDREGIKSFADEVITVNSKGVQLQWRRVADHIYRSIGGRFILRKIGGDIWVILDDGEIVEGDCHEVFEDLETAKRVAEYRNSKGLRP